MKISKLIQLVLFLTASVTFQSLSAQTLQLSKEQAIQLVNKIKQLDAKAKEFDKLYLLASNMECVIQKERVSYNVLLRDYQRLAKEYQTYVKQQTKKRRRARLRESGELILIVIITGLALLSK